MALKFISGNPRVLLGRVPEIEGVTALTIAAWVKLAHVDSDMVIAMRGSAFGGSTPWVLYRDEVALTSGRTNTLAGQLMTNVGLLRVESASAALNDTAWHHIAWVFEAGSATGLRLYLDGVQDPHVTSTVGHSSLTADTSDVQWGFNQAGVQFQGAMADGLICDSALTASDIARLASRFSAMSVPGVRNSLVVYQDFIRDANRPGIGPAATTAGTLGVEAHPPLWFPPSSLASVSSAHSLVRSPWRAERGVSLANAAAAGELFIPGAARGAVHSIGEVHP